MREDVPQVVVAGLGAVGSAALYHLARAGVRALGIDPRPTPHPFGSTHGATRIHRRAYMEGAEYLPVLERAEALWLGLERDSGRSILRRTGALMLGPGDGPLLAGSAASAQAGGVPHERLTAAGMARRYPWLAVPPGAEGLLEPGAGALSPEAAVEAHLDGARKEGAVVRFGEGVVAWEGAGDHLRLRTGRGTVQADALVLAVGAWTPGLLARQGVEGREIPALEVERQVTGRFGARGGAFPASLPILLFDRGEEPLLYAVPEPDGLLKAGLHHGGERGRDPSVLRREALSEDEVRIAIPLSRLIPSVEPRWRDGSVCLYTNAPGGRWWIAPLPQEPRVILASACSGHGFKASSAVGEAAACLARGVDPPFDLTPFRRPLQP